MEQALYIEKGEKKRSCQGVEDHDVRLNRLKTPDLILVRREPLNTLNIRKTQNHIMRMVNFKMFRDFGKPRSRPY